MSKRLSVHLLPSLTTSKELRGGVVIVVDILRATTTMVYAMAAGAFEIRPCLEVDEARAMAARLGNGALLGGERGGRPISGFDLGNSPAEYTAEKVRGKTIVFSTTNGTRALGMCGEAAETWVGSFANFSAICNRVRDSGEVQILCAGTDGEITREDVLFAGAVAHELSLDSASGFLLNDGASLAADAWRGAERAMRGSQPLAETLRASRGGRNLVEIGHERDIEIAAHLDRFDLTPRYDAVGGRVYLP